MQQFLKPIFGIELYMFWDSVTCMTYTYCCVHSTTLLMMNRKPVRNI